MTSEELNMYIDYMDEDGNKESHDYNLHLLQQYFRYITYTNKYTLKTNKNIAYIANGVW